MTRRPRSRRWLAPEVVQTSVMDCGPAALKCLLEGFGIPVSYGRLREACQTSVDGTSIDAIEVVANQLGVCAEQMIVPADHVFSDPANLPALVAVRHADGPTHFVVIWGRVGSWLQVMDPAVGRRWVTCDRFAGEMLRHETSVPAAEWRAWAATDDCLVPLRARLAGLGADAPTATTFIDAALADEEWFGCGALDAAARLVTQVVTAHGVKRGPEAVRLLAAVLQQTRTHPDSIFATIPPPYWSVLPDVHNTDASHQRLVIAGAVLMRVAGRRDAGEVAAAAGALAPELAAALTEKPVHPLRAFWELLRADGLLAPLAMAGALAIAVAALLIEALLFRGIFDLGGMLALGSQRLVAALALLAFTAVSIAVQLPIVGESLRFGRRVEARLRMALLRKLPHLGDRYFQSRPVSDMADRSHSIRLTRLLPAMGVHALQASFELVFTVIGIAILDPASAPLALSIAAVAIGTPIALQPIVAERDLRVRNQAAALSRFYLDALLGLVPIRAHRAEMAVRRQHESLLVDWVRSTIRLVRISTITDGVQATACVSLAAVLLVSHFVRSSGVTGADLLLVYWALKLPTVGHTLAGLVLRYPVQRNVLLRVMEPLAAPEAPAASRSAGAARASVSGGAHIVIEGGMVVAGGHTILRDVDLEVRPGEHVAIVGPSGAGKSTLVGLLLGWHRLAAGRVLVDGAELSDIALDDLRRQTAWVDPAVQLWNRSLLDNLTFSSPDDGAPRAAAAVDGASLRSVLQKLPQGLQTALGEGGALLSGGEGQRVRLARALTQSNVRLALLDEPFRGLDRGRRSTLLADARRHWTSATMLCVTHDVADTLAFDRVIVVEDGRIVEDDSPLRLADRRSRYRALLDAEQRVRSRMWNGEQWRRVRVDGGRVAEVSRQWMERLLVS